MPNAGFDRLDYPGVATMNDLLANTNLKWCGYYLAPAPNRPNSSWMGTYQALAGNGWGFAPIYVGQQQGGASGANPNLSFAQGTADGNAAVGLAFGEGFANNSYIYLDIENGPPVFHEMLDYASAWATAVITGGYNAGIYCSYLIQPDLQAVCPASARFWVFKVSPGQPAVFSTPFSELDPTIGTGIANAGAWQYVQNIEMQWGGNSLQPVDLSTSAMPDPSK